MWHLLPWLKASLKSQDELQIASVRLFREQRVCSSRQAIKIYWASRTMSRRVLAVPCPIAKTHLSAATTTTNFGIPVDASGPGVESCVISGSMQVGA